jgi:hypothetical protein
MAAVLTLWVGQTGRGLQGGSTATFFRISWKWRLRIPPILLYPCTKLNVIISCNSVTLIFTTVVTLKSRVVLLCFSFPVQETRSVCKQHGHKHTPTECYCRLRMVSNIQRKVSTGGQLVWQARCALKVNTHKDISCLLCDVLSKHKLCVSTPIVYGRFYRCSCCVLHAHLPLFTADRHTDRQTDTHTHSRVTYCVCLWQIVTSVCYIDHIHLYLIQLCATRKYFSIYYCFTCFKQQIWHVSTINKPVLRCV